MRTLKVLAMVAVAVTLFAGSFVSVMAQGTGKRPTGQELDAIIDRYEKLLDQCSGRRYNDRCANVMYELGGFYYDKSKESSTPSYDKSLRMYWRLTREYPSSDIAPKVLNQMGEIYFNAGHIDTTRVVYEQLVAKYPRSSYATIAQLRLSNIALADGNYAKACASLKGIKKNEVSQGYWGLIYLLSGACASNSGDFVKAVGYFSEYMELCNDGKCSYSIGNLKQTVEHLKNYVEKTNSGEYKKNKKSYDLALKTLATAEKRLADAEAKHAKQVAAKAKRAADEAAAKAEKEAAEAAAAAELAAELAAIEALPLVPTGTGYDKVSWGTSMAEVKRIYRDLKEEQKFIYDMVALTQENVGGGIGTRMFGFHQDKLALVGCSYGALSDENVALLMEKITSAYGKVTSSTTTDKGGEKTGEEIIKHIWKYKQTEVLLHSKKSMSMTKTMQRDMKREYDNLVNKEARQGLTPYEHERKTNIAAFLFLGSSSSVSINVTYEDIPAMKQIRADDDAKTKQKEVEAKKKRSDALGL